MAGRRRLTDEGRAIRAAQQMLATQQGRRMLLLLAVIAAIVWGGSWLYDRVRHRGGPPVVTRGPDAPATAPAGPTVRIATWNLHKSGRKGFDAALAARVIREGKLDVVALQEVTREDAKDVRRSGSGVQRLVDELGPPWRIAGVSDETGNHEHFAYIYDAGHVQSLGPPHWVASTQSLQFDRWPYQASFRCGQFDFTLVQVHLYYGDGSAADRARRRREAEALAGLARNLAAGGPERDVIVLGDFNEERTVPVLDTFERQGWALLLPRGSGTNLSSTETFDNLVADPAQTREYAGAAGVVRFDEAHFPNDRPAAAAALSDHRPAWADFVITLPDDD